MSEYVSQDEIDQRLGLTPQNPTLEQSRDARVQVIEPEPAHNSSQVKVKVVEPDDDHEPSPTKLKETVAKEDVKQASVSELEERLVRIEQERDAAIAKVKTLDDSHKQEAETAKAQARELNAQRESSEKETKTTKAELEQTNAELGETRAQLEKSQRAVSNLNSKVGTLEAEIEAAKCPECGNIVGWNVLPAEQYDESEVNGNKKPILPRIIIPLVYGKRCPVCKHFEQIKK